MEVTVKKLSDVELNNLGVFGWGIWEKEKSVFDWFYSEEESCYFLEGEVEVNYDNKTVRFGKGDFVKFPKGLKCIWKILRDVKKHYKFG